MAVYPAGNPGVSPVDTTTDIGKFRVRIQDTVGVAYDPVVAGYANYAKISDDEIQVFLDDNSSVYWALSEFYSILADSASVESKVVKDADLMVDLTKRASELRESAARWAIRAEEEDGLLGTNDVFEILPALGSAVVPFRAEAF